MSRLTKALALINDVVGPIGDPSEEAKYASVFVGIGAGTVVLEIAGQDNGASPAVDDWVAVSLTVAGVSVANIVAGGSAQWGYALVPGAHKVRVRETANGAVRVTLALSEL